jgi:hypothetical protein
MKRFAVLVVFLALACRTGRPAGTPVSPLRASSPEQALEQLRARREAFTGMRSLMRVRAMTGDRTQSFRAQLALHDRRRFDLIAYTPVGTTALTMNVDGDRVQVRNHLENTNWNGTARDLPEPFKFLGASVAPADVAMLILGLPIDGVAVTADAAGLRTASLADVAIAYDPPSFPARNVVVTRGADRVEIEHLEVVAD